ncbi:immunoglobulin-like domain-containing protein, partial [Klebsiella pneumoniae]|uniref:immunoglobulin-like domain-containing protein n=1 Tax=Klebsiella pneumoniae TaxID=573 RepID=UPI003B9863BC
TGSVTVASSDDVYGQTDGTTQNVSITGTTGGNYESLDTSDTATTTVTEPTADETTVSLSATDTNEAAGTVTFTATLSNPVLAGDDPVIV